MANNESLSPSNIISANLDRVSGVLQDMQGRGNAASNAQGAPLSPGIPPAVFGAGGTM